MANELIELEAGASASWKKYIGRIVGAILGIIIGILLLTIGFWRTLLLAAFAAAGWWLSVLIQGGLLKRLKEALLHIIKKSDLE